MSLTTGWQWLGRPLVVSLLAGLAVPALAAAAPVLTIIPTAGPPGTVVTLRATGLSPTTTYLVQLVSGTGNINTVRLVEITATTDANGDLAGTLTVRQPPGAYTVRVVAWGGTILAMAPLTITPANGGGLPGLPRTGGGGMAAWPGQVGPALAGLALAILALRWAALPLSILHQAWTLISRS